MANITLMGRVYMKIYAVIHFYLMRGKKWKPGLYLVSREFHGVESTSVKKLTKKKNC